MQPPHISLTPPAYPPGGTPAQPAQPAPAPPKRSRIVERYGETFCAECGFPAQHCGCDRPDAASAAPDGGESDLQRRVRQARSGR